MNSNKEDIFYRRKDRKQSMKERKKMKNEQLDAVDRKILQMLQNDGRIPLKEIAKEVFLTAPAVSARINQLIEKKYILGFHAVLNPELLGYHIKAFINLEVKPMDKKDFYNYIKKYPNVMECNCVTGEYSMLLQVFFKNTAELDSFIGELQDFGRTKTLIVFSTAIEHRGVTVMQEDENIVE